MKKIILCLCFLVGSYTFALAAQQTISQITTPTATREALRAAVNLRLVAAQGNFTELYTLVGQRPWLSQTTAPSDTTLMWIDTSGEVLILKYHDGSDWVALSFGSDGSYTLPTASATVLGGVKVGDRLTITDGVLSADVQSGIFDPTADIDFTGVIDFTGATVTGLGAATIPSATEGQILQADSGGVYQSVSEIAGLINDDCLVAGDCGLDDILPASQVVSELAGKQDTLSAASTIIALFSGTGDYLKSDGTKGTPSGGTLSITEQDADPEFSSMASGDLIVSKASGDLFAKTSTGGYVIAGAYTADPVTYSLTVTPTDFTGADKFTYSATDYTTEQVITGLTADATFTVTPDAGRAITCAGTGLTDNTGGSYTANTDTASVVATCTSSESVVDYCADKLGSYALYYDVDHPDGVNTACITGDTATSIFTGVSASTTVNTTVGGTNGVLTDTADNHYVEIPATGITSTSGRISVKITTPAVIPANTNIAVFAWESSETAGVRYFIQKMGENEYRAVGYHYDGSTVTALPGAFIPLPAASAILCVLDWNSTTGTVTTAFNGTTGTATGTISSFSTPSHGVRFGAESIVGGDNIALGFDDIYLGASQQ